MFSKTLYRFIVLLMSCLVLALTACTGTQASAEPLFLIAGVQDDSGANPRVVVVQDRVLERFVTFAFGDLEATARAFDLVDESGTREELVVLSRSQEGDTVTAFLEFFNTRGLLVDEPEETFFDTRPDLDLQSLTYPPSFDVSTLCPIDMEVTRNGSRVLIFSSPSTCFPGSSDADDAIVVLAAPAKRPGTTPASVLSVILSSNAPAKLLVKSRAFEGSVRSGMYLDQSTDTLYYLRRSVNQVELRRLESSTYTSSDPEPNPTGTQPIAGNIDISNEQFRDLKKIGGNIAVLGPNDYVLVPSSGTNVEVTTVDTGSVGSQASRAFVPDATSSSLFILDDNDKLIYHADPTLPANTEADVTGTLSALNTNSDFLYVLGINSDDEPLVTVFDLQPLFNEGNTNLESLLTEESCGGEGDGLCALTNPTALTWAEGILLPTDETP